MKRELKTTWKDVLDVLEFEPQNIKSISVKADVSWETTKNCLETLEHLEFIKSTLDKKTRKYSKKQFIDLDIRIREILLRGMRGFGVELNTLK